MALTFVRVSPKIKDRWFPWWPTFERRTSLLTYTVTSSQVPVKTGRDLLPPHPSLCNVQRVAPHPLRTPSQPVTLPEGPALGPRTPRPPPLPAAASRTPFVIVSNTPLDSRDLRLSGRKNTLLSTSTVRDGDLNRALLGPLHTTTSVL